MIIIVVGRGAEQLRLAVEANIKFRDSYKTFIIGFRACRLKSMTGLIRSLCSFIMIIIAALRCDSTRQGSLRIRGDGQGRLIQHQNVFLCWCMYNRYVYTNICLSFIPDISGILGILIVNIFIDADQTGLRGGWPPRIVSFDTQTPEIDSDPQTALNQAKLNQGIFC